ncbi:MAG: DNA alkylation repair protein [Mangrovibacterium sp.]
MDVMMDDPATEMVFRELLTKVRLRKNGETVAQMKRMGVNYKINWGVSVIHLRELASGYNKNHLLALKLWNKGWRETLILASLLDEPDRVSEEQLDYWIKSAEYAEIIEQTVMNLYVHTKFAFVKAMEYCCGKKYLVHYAGLLLLGRLAMVDKKAINEMFETFFPIIIPLSKDPQLAPAFYRTLVIIANRNEELRKSTVGFLEQLRQLDEEQAKKMAVALLEEINYGDEN